ncbi:MAG: hypothetical protein CO108_20625, partial [Deltaproteobacteria bacterium CG_4_9_14_3_um_filter_63_12]
VFKTDIGTWIVIGIVGYLALGVGMWGGFQNCALKASRGEKVEMGDVFYPFSRFADFFIPAVIVGVGFVLCMIPGVVLAIWWYYAYPIMIEEGIGWSEATKKSKEKASQYLVPTFITLFVGNIVGGILGPITMALSGLVQVDAYNKVFKG